MNTVDKYKGYRSVTIMANYRLQFQIGLSNGETEATTCSLADTEHLTIPMERESHCITSNELKQFKMEFSIRMIKFEA
jgi:hypothetical protein